MKLLSFSKSSAPRKCSATDTSKEVTHSIAKDNSDVIRFSNLLKRVSNNFTVGFRPRRENQVAELIKLAESAKNNDKNAEELQKTARATKQIFKGNLRNLKIYIRIKTAGGVRYNEQTTRQLRIITDGYKLAKAIQHNDENFLSSNSKLILNRIHW